MPEEFSSIFSIVQADNSNWRWPDIPGLFTFEGKLLHSAKWDNSYDYNGKVVAVIGNGSSAIQIVPKLQKGNTFKYAILTVVAKQLISFQRSSTWVTPTPGLTAPSPDDPKLDINLQYTLEERKRFEEDPQYLLEHRNAIYNQGGGNFSAYFMGSESQQASIDLFAKTMKQRLKHDEKLINHILPSYPPGCRRLTPGPGFLEALVEENVTVITTAIEMITPKGVRTIDGKEYECDVLVCATGFDTTYRPRFSLIGRNEQSLSEEWTANIPQAYWGVAVPGYPNYFSISFRFITNNSIHGSEYTSCKRDFVRFYPSPRRLFCQRIFLK